MNIEVFYSRKTDNWMTPREIYFTIINKGYEDPCPYMAKFNGLEKNYYNSKLYINPPFSLMNEFAEFGLKQSKNNKVVFLIPARTDTRYFHKLLSAKPSIFFIKV